MGSGGKEAGRELSRAVATYGFPAGKTCDYRTWFRLLLNIDRVNLWLANRIGIGGQMASGREPDRAWADALAGTSLEAEEIYFEMKADWRHREKGD